MAKIFSARLDEAVLSRLRTGSVTQEVVDDAAEIYREWLPACGMDVNDARLAATVAATGGRLCTLNVSIIR